MRLLPVAAHLGALVIFVASMLLAPVTGYTTQFPVGAECSDSSGKEKIVINYAKSLYLSSGESLPNTDGSWIRIGRSTFEDTPGVGGETYEFHYGSWRDVGSIHFKFWKEKGRVSAKFRKVQLRGCAPDLGFGCSDAGDPVLTCQEIDKLPIIKPTPIPIFPVCARSAKIKEYFEKIFSLPCSQITGRTFVEKAPTGIYLSNSGLTTLAENDLDGIELAPIQVVDLSHNQLTKLPENLFGTHNPSNSIVTRTTYELKLSNNQLRDLPTSLIKNCSRDCSYKSVDLSFNQFEQFPNIFPLQDCIQKNQKWQCKEVISAKYVNLSHNMLTLEEFQAGSGKTFQIRGGGLNLSHNRITSIPGPTEDGYTVIASDSSSFTLVLSANPIQNLKLMIRKRTSGSGDFALYLNELETETTEILVDNRIPGVFVYLGGTESKPLNLQTVKLGSIDDFYLDRSLSIQLSKTEGTFSGRNLFTMTRPGRPEVARCDAKTSEVYLELFFYGSKVSFSNDLSKETPCPRVTYKPVFKDLRFQNTYIESLPVNLQRDNINPYRTDYCDVHVDRESSMSKSDFAAWKRDTPCSSPSFDPSIRPE